MKRTLRTIFAAAALFSAFAFTACNDAIVDDGTNVKNYNNGSGSGSGGGGGWGLCKNSAYKIFDIQVWGDGAGKFDYVNSSGYGHFSVTEYGGGWVGGGLVSSEAGKTFNVSNVEKMKFEIRGNISPKALSLSLQGGGGENSKMYPAKSSIATSGGVSVLDEEEWTEVTLNCSGCSNDSIINAFCLIIAGDWGGSYSVGNWFDIRNLDWVDSAGNSVTISLK